MSVRINKYLADQKYCTRRAADALIAEGKVLVNGVPAVLGQKVSEGDKVEVRFRPKKYRYYAYHKPTGIITHSAQGEEEEEIMDIAGLEGVFPLGRLDKESHGLIILTDDGRLTDPLLNPKYDHEKEYEVRVATKLPADFVRSMEKGVDIGDYVTKPCVVTLLDDKRFTIILTEGKKHQIRRMCGALGQSVVELKRVRIENIELGKLASGSFRALKGEELMTLLSSCGISS